MKIDVTKIEGYDKMSAEEKLKALEEFEIEEPKSDDPKLKSALDKATAEAAKYKKELREKQTEQERLEAERKEADEKKDAELAELRKGKLIAEHKANFLKVGYSEELAEKSANAVVDGDFKTIFDGLNMFLEAREKQIKEELVKKTPHPRSDNGNETVTKEQFEKMSLTERTKLFNENKDLYNELKGD